jgi:predicted Fe-Mo cluster-binding NifX family protein
VITGNVGPNAHRVLAAAGITVYQAGNGVTAREALASFRRGGLTAVGSPTVAGHWS